MTSTTGVDFTTTDYDAPSQTAQFTFEPDASTTSMAVVAALSEVVETDPALLEPLHTFVDTDALDALLGRGDGRESSLFVTFTAMGHTVTVHQRGAIEITDAATAQPDESPKSGSKT
jgi:hypothetical protein